MELHRAVQQAVAQGRFSRPPIHVGSSLSLSDGRWAAAVDVALGPLLNGWIVHNGGDRALLQARVWEKGAVLSPTASHPACPAAAAPNKQFAALQPVCWLAAAMLRPFAMADPCRRCGAACRSSSA